MSTVPTSAPGALARAHFQAGPNGGRTRLARGLHRARRRFHGAARHHDRDRRAAQSGPAALRPPPWCGSSPPTRSPTASPWFQQAGPATGSVTSRCSPHRPDHLHAGQRGLRAVAEPGRDRRRPALSRALEPGSSTRPSPRPSSCRSLGPSDRRRSAPSWRHDRRVHRAWAGAGRPDHRGRGYPRRLALAVPGELVHRRCRAADGRLAVAPRVIAHPPPVRPGRAVPAVRRAAPAAHPAGGR